VWDFVFNSSSRAAIFVHFRDFEQRATYAGFVEVFSESGPLREIVLRDVTVYDFEQTELYRLRVSTLLRAREHPYRIPGKSLEEGMRHGRQAAINAG